MRYKLKVTALLACFLFLMLVVISINLNNEVDKTNEWDEFYNETVINYFVLPEKIIVKEAKLSVSEFMGMNFTVIFEINDKFDPYYWVNKIAVDSKIPDSYRVNSLQYDCLAECDLYKFYYDSDTKLYVIKAGWD